MEKKQLTNEFVKKRFNSSFQLVNYAIKLAKNMIAADRPCRVDTQIQNRSYQVLLEIGEGRDHIDALPRHEEGTAETLPDLEEIIKKTVEKKRF